MDSSYPVRDPGDAWVESSDGRKFWGRFGAAGLLVHHPDAGILLQHRVEWSHHGGTWGLPGGAINEHESAVRAALREANEEAGVPEAQLTLRFMSVLDLGFWSYTTLVAHANDYFEPRIGDRESVELRWVPTDAVTELPLHPGFANAWPGLRADLGRRVVLVVDGANVVGTRPDGWWRDHIGAAERLAGALIALSSAGIHGAGLGLARARWWPDVLLVVEGKASAARLPVAPAPASSVHLIRAEHDGDSAIVDTVRDLNTRATAGGLTVVVVTSDRELSVRVTDLGAVVRSAGWLLKLLDAG